MLPNCSSEGLRYDLIRSVPTGCFVLLHIICIVGLLERFGSETCFSTVFFLVITVGVSSCRCFFVTNATDPPFQQHHQFMFEVLYSIFFLFLFRFDNAIASVIRRVLVTSRFRNVYVSMQGHFITSCARCLKKSSCFTKHTSEKIVAIFTCITIIRCKHNVKYDLNNN